MKRFDIESFIDGAPLGATQILSLVACVLICFIDGFDLVLLGKIAPAIAAGYGEKSAAMTPVFVYQQIGLAFGAFTMTPLADRQGRRSMLIFSCLVLGLMTLAIPYARDLHSFALMRGISGIFMAAALPMALALISEITPTYRRSTLVAVALAGYSVGSAASGFVAAWLLDDFGWESGFWIGGTVPLLCVLLLILFVPESPRFLASRDPSDPRISPILRRLNPSLSLSGDEIFTIGSSSSLKGRKAKLGDIFSDGRCAPTILIWACSALSVTNVVLLGTWLPSFFQEMAGIPIQQFAIVAIIGYLGGGSGPLAVGWMMDRTRPPLLLAGFYVSTAICMNMLAWVPFYTTAFIVVVVFWAFSQSGSSAGLSTLITHVYPPRMRSTALGWASGAGRIGAVIAPIAGGFALAEQFSLQLTMAMAAALPVGVAMLMLALMKLNKHQNTVNQETVAG